MRKFRTRFFSIFLLISCMLTITAQAQEIVPYASDQIHAYDGDAIACGGGKIAIEFSIEGTGRMKSIGASKIRISERYGDDGWMTAGGFKSTDEGMTVSGRNSYGTTIYFNGEEGTYYKVEITVFATDYDGVTDSRTVTCYVTA